MDGSARDLWVRLGALEKTCTVRLESYYTSTDPIEAVFRWRASVTPRQTGTAREAIVVEGVTAVEALMEAIERAELQRWGDS
jgi:hypothetical protein